jgi:glycosyltransferase involved in cell wall biosynthesis
MNHLGVSIIICCYNSAARLEKTLTCIYAQRNLTFPVEIIVVDNNSTDDTSIVASMVRSKADTNITQNVVLEPKAGLSFARDKGILHSKYEYIIFCDDDNLLEENYVSIAYELMQSNLKIGIAGGQSVISTEAEEPFWFEKYKEYYAVGKQHFEDGDVTTVRGYLWGAGMVIRKSSYNFVSLKKYKSILTDRKGSSLASGGDSEICKWFIMEGFLLWYNSRLKFEHFVPSNRLKWNYFFKLFSGIGLAHIYLSLYDYSKSNSSFFLFWRNQFVEAFRNFYLNAKAIPFHKLAYSINKKPEGQIRPIIIHSALKKMMFLVFNIRRVYGAYKIVKLYR